MASNSDSIYHVLTIIRSHPEYATAEPLEYSNVITYSIPDHIKVSDPDIYFPDQELMVNRLTPDFVAKHGDLLDYFYDFTSRKIPNYHDVWVTSSHIINKQAYLIELSYE